MYGDGGTAANTEEAGVTRKGTIAVATLAVALAMAASLSLAAATPAPTCPDAGSGCPAPAASANPFTGAGPSSPGVARQPRIRMRASAPPTVTVLAPRRVTCCSAQLRGTVTFTKSAHTGRVTDYFVLERDGGPRPVDMSNAVATLPNRSATYTATLNWTQLPSCSSFRYWLVAHDNQGTATGGPVSFATNCPPMYISWSIGQFYRGASPTAPALGTLDSQPAARALGRALAALGYHSHTLVNGQRPGAILREASAASVIAIFDHADPGIILTHGGGTRLCRTEGLVASAQYTFACAPTRWLRFGSLPAADLWSVRLMIFGGCQTAGTSPTYGNLLGTASSLGVNTAVGFARNVFFPGSAKHAGRTTGGLFWSRFAAYVRQGATVRRALQRAQADLIRRAGRPWGYNSWVVSGAAADPGALRLAISGPHAAPDIASSSRDRAGNLSWYAATATRVGRLRVSQADAEATARRFLALQDRALGADVIVSRERVSHAPGEQVESMIFRSLVHGIPGPSVAEVDVDLRSGAVVYLAAGQVRPRALRFRLGRAAAVRRALAATGGGRVVSASPDVWAGPRWTVILRPRDRRTVTMAVDINALTGAVSSIDESDPS